MQVIDVDPELQRDAVKRTLAVEGNDLVAYVFTRRCSLSYIERDLGHLRLRLFD
jgi:EKC/KEOPS complex subunit PCC1/LAGE3